MSRQPSGLQLVWATVVGAVMSVVMYVPEAIATVREMRRNNRQVMSLFEQEAADLRISGAPEEHWTAHRRQKLGFTGVRLWYLTVFPIYQVADDVPGYWIYLNLHGQFGAVWAYVLTAVGTAGVATGLGQIQRRAEAHRADLMRVGSVDDDADNTKYLLDAAVMSAPWQVYRKANAKPRTRATGAAPISLTPPRRIVQYGALYGLVNTTLYVVGKYLPVADWPGFAYSLIAATAISGGYLGLKKAREATVSTHGGAHV